MGVIQRTAKSDTKDLKSLGLTAVPVRIRPCIQTELQYYFGCLVIDSLSLLDVFKLALNKIDINDLYQYLFYLFCIIK